MTESLLATMQECVISVAKRLALLEDKVNVLIAESRGQDKRNETFEKKLDNHQQQIRIIWKFNQKQIEINEKLIAGAK